MNIKFIKSSFEDIKKEYIVDRRLFRGMIKMLSDNAQKELNLLEK